MSTKSENGGEVTQLKTWIVMILIALIGGGGTNYAFNRAKPPRPDPFTGTQARFMEERLNARLNSMEEQHQNLLQTVTTILQHDAKIYSTMEDHRRRLDLMDHKHLKMMEDKSVIKTDDAKHHSMIHGMNKKIEQLDNDVRQVLREHKQNRVKK